MGQFRADRCPLCGTADKTSRWTCASCTALVGIYRNLVKNLQWWHSAYSALDVPDVLVGSDGNEYCLWDVDRFYDSRTALAEKMRLSIEYCLYENMLERDAAVRMGVSATNPVLIYATIGLTHLLAHHGLSGQEPLLLERRAS